MTRSVVTQRQLGKTSMFVLLLLVLSAGNTRGQQNKPPTIEEIQKAWQARQDRVRSARIAWKEQRTFPKGSISLMYPPEAVDKVPEIKGKIMPPADTTVDFSYEVAIDSEKVRFEYEGKEWSNGRQAFRPTRYVSVFNGKTAKDVYPIGLADIDWPQGAIRNGIKYRDAGLSSLLPLILVYRPFAPSLKNIDDIRGMTQVGQMKLDGRPCFELVQRLTTSSIHIWVDPARDFVLTRRLVIDQGKPREQIDIRYHHDDKIGWVPISWRIVDHHYNGKIFYSFNAEVIRTDVNMGLDPTTFDFDFPRGTWVIIEKTHETYLVRGDGTKRPVVGKEMSYTYEQLMDTDAVESPITAQFLKSNWGLVTVVLIGVLALGVFIWRRFRLRET